MTSRFGGRFALTAALLAAGILGGATGSKAAILIDLKSGGAEAFTYTNGNSGAFLGTVGAYSGTVNTGATNFPGTPAFGSLTATTNFSTTTAPTAPLVVTVSVVNGGGTDTGANAVAGPPPAGLTVLSTFTLPPGSQLLLGSTIANSNPLNTGAPTQTVTFTSTANGVSTTPLTIPYIPAGRNDGGPTTTPFGGPGYTLFNTTTISGLPAGVSNYGSTGTSTVTAIPEPATMAMAVLALPVLGIVRRFRRRGAQA